MCLPVDFCYMPVDSEFESTGTNGLVQDEQEGQKSNRGTQEKNAKPQASKQKKPEEAIPQVNNSMIAFLMNLQSMAFVDEVKFLEINFAIKQGTFAKYDFSSDQASKSQLEKTIQIGDLQNQERSKEGPQKLQTDPTQTQKISISQAVSSSANDNDKPTFVNGLYIVDYGPDTRQNLSEDLADCRYVMWLGQTGIQKYWKDGDQKIAKLLKQRRELFKLEEEAIPEDEKIDYLPFNVSITGASLIDEINAFNLKDPKPTKAERKVKQETNKNRDEDIEDDDEQEEDQDEEPEEDEEDAEEEEDEYDEEIDDDDLNSEEIKKLKRKQNIDHITDHYHPDESFFLKLMSGRYFEGKA